MARLMSEAEQRRRQKLQGKIGRTTSTLGLSGLAVTGAAAVAARKPGALKAIQKVPGLKGTTPKKMKAAAINTGIVSGGIGGVGGFNQASIYSAESRRKQKKVVVVQKSSGVEPLYAGEVAKAWSPVASNFDSEASRHKRGKAYQGATVAAGGAAGAYSVHQGRKAVKASRGLKSHEVTSVIRQGGQKKVSTAEANIWRGLPKAQVGRIASHSGKAAAGAAAVGGAVLAHGALKRKRQGSWQSYEKRDTTSAFGIDHEVSKAIHIKEENRGKFTAAAKKAGEGIQEHAHAVVSSNKASALQKKRAQFAINAKKWHHR